MENSKYHLKIYKVNYSRVVKKKKSIEKLNLVFSINAHISLEIEMSENLL